MGDHRWAALTTTVTALVCAGLAGPPAYAEPAGGPAARIVCQPGTSMRNLGIVWTCQKAGSVATWVATGSFDSGRLVGHPGVCARGDALQVGKVRLTCDTVRGKWRWTRTAGGGASPSASSYVQSRPGRLSGRCTPASWIQLESVKVTCEGSGAERAWSANGNASIEDTSPSADLHTLTRDQVNTAFQVWPTVHPEIAQSLVVTSGAVVSDATFLPIEFHFASPEFWAQGNSPQDKTWFVRDATPIPVTVRATLYRADSATPLPEQFDLASGFTKVAEGTSSSPLRATVPYTVTFGSPVTLRPGQYVVVFSFSFPDSQVLNVRLAGRQSGHNATYGEDHSAPSDCVYTPATDGYPQGRAYKGLGRGQDSLPSPMVATASVGFGTRFVQQEAKTYDCQKLGVFRDVWNPGDLLVSFSTSPLGKPMPSVRPPLPSAAYAGLACDPADPRLSGRALANGVGPEARVADACVQLDWLAGPATSSRPITVHTSTGVPESLTRFIRTAIAAGDRMNGRYASPERTYEMVMSTDPAWSCQTGARLYDSRTVGVTSRLFPWRVQENSGCSGAEFRIGGGGASILGPSGDTYFSWTLIPADDLARMTVDTVNSPTWYLRFLSHEYVHAIQWQRGASGSPEPLEHFRFIEHPGAWFSEGQAQYLGFAAGALSTTTPDMRQVMLDQLRDDVARLGVASVDVGGPVPNNDMRFIYSTGYFAYEYLLAHFGSAALWNSWNLWNSTPCSNTGRNLCWRERSVAAFGVTADALVSEVNRYINAQLTG